MDKDLVGQVVDITRRVVARINASSIGGPAEIPEKLRAGALQRAMTFESRGVQLAGN